MLVVWERENAGIYGRSVQVPSFGDPGGGTTHSYYASSNAHRPSLSASTDSIGFHLLVWQQFYSTPAPGDHDLLGQVVSTLGSSIGGVLTIAGLVGPDEVNPQLDGDGHSWLIAYGEGDSLFTLDHSLRCASVVDSGLGFVVDRTGVLIDDQPGVDERYGRVAHTGDAYVLAYLGREPGAATLSVLLKTVDAFCGDCGDLEVLDQGYASLGAEFALASQRSGTGSAVPPHEALVAYSSWTAPGSGGQIQGAIWRTEAGAYTYISTGCSSGYSLAPCAMAGNANFAHRLAGADPFRDSWLVLGLEPGGVACGISKCNLAVDPFSASVVSAGLTDSLGRNAVFTPLPDSPALVGLSFREQWAYTPPVGSGTCPDLGVHLSDGLLVTIE